jgi:hypothetical protein
MATVFGPSPSPSRAQSTPHFTNSKIITFTVAFDFGGMPFMLSYKGIVSPEEIKMSGDAAGMPFEFVLKKAK